MTHEPVKTMEDLATLDDTEIVAGYRAAKDKHVLDGTESRSFVHGWRNGRADSTGEVSQDQVEFARVWVKSKKDNR